MFDSYRDLFLSVNFVNKSAEINVKSEKDIQYTQYCTPQLVVFPEEQSGN